MTQTYRIREWDERYEVNDRNRAWQPGEVKRRSPLEYIRLPVHGARWGQSYRRFLAAAGKDAPAVYGVWIKLLEMSADRPRDMRGIPGDDRGFPGTPGSIAELLGWDERIVKKALEVLSSKEVGWLEPVEVPGNSRKLPETPGSSPSEADTELETESETESVAYACAETESPVSPPPVLNVLLTFPCDGKAREWHLTESQVQQWQTLFPSLDVPAECRSAYAWVTAIPERRKTAKGMPRFLASWLARAQDRGGRNAKPLKPRLQYEMSDDTINY